MTFASVNAITNHNVLHEGAHVMQAQAFFAGMTPPGPNANLQMTTYDSESAAYGLNAVAAAEFGAIAYGKNREHKFTKGMTPQQMQAIIDAILRDPNLGYDVSPQNPRSPWP